MASGVSTLAIMLTRMYDTPRDVLWGFKKVRRVVLRYVWDKQLFDAFGGFVEL